MLARRIALEVPFSTATSVQGSNHDPLLVPATPPVGNPRPLKVWKKTEADAVGLGIVAALEKARPVPSNPTVAIRARPAEAALDLPVADFLRCCCLCSKKLHGRDIYMYRGEKGFCSMECRYQHIVGEECTDKCVVAGVLRPAETSSPSSGNSHDHLFFAGITAA